MKQLSKQFQVEGYRPIGLELYYTTDSLTKKHYLKTIHYNQGNTAAMAQQITNQNPIGTYHVASRHNLIYGVSALADKLTGGTQRKNRRHTEISRFLSAIYLNLGYYSKTFVKPTIFVKSTDGSSRVTALNAGAIYMCVENTLNKKETVNLPVGISFGGVVEESIEKVVYDLDYVQDSTGIGDCALGCISTLNSNGTIEKFNMVSILYEGCMLKTLFVEGLENSISYMHQWVKSVTSGVGVLLENVH